MLLTQRRCVNPSESGSPISQVVFITGSSRGLGRAIAVAALDAGHRVVATARDPETLRELVAAAPDRALAVALDVTSPAAADASVAAAVARFGGLDVIVNNAGYANVAAIEDVDPEDFRAQLEANFFGVVNVTRAALPVMRRQGRGHVIQVSSVGGRLATPGLAAYQSAKWAVGGFSGVLAAEVAPLGIHVTVLEPGGMQTDWAGSSMQIAPVSDPYRETVGAMAALHASDRIALGDPARVAAAVLRVAAMDDPPGRLLLGSDALAYATAAGRAQLQSDERWRELSASTDRADATDADRDPLGTRG